MYSNLLPNSPQKNKKKWQNEFPKFTNSSSNSPKNSLKYFLGEFGAIKYFWFSEFVKICLRKITILMQLTSWKSKKKTKKDLWKESLLRTMKMSLREKIEDDWKWKSTKSYAYRNRRREFLHDHMNWNDFFLINF